MYSNRDQYDGDDVLDPEFFVQKEGGEDDTQNRDQGIVDGDLADRMIGR